MTHTRPTAPTTSRRDTLPAGRASPRWLLPVGVAVLAATLAVYGADLVAHPAAMATMRDLAVYRAGGLIARHVSPPYDAAEPVPLYDWRSAQGVGFTYPPFAALIFAVGSLLSWTALRWAMTVASLTALFTASWLVARAFGHADRRVRTGVAALVTAVALATEPVQVTLLLGQINLLLLLLVAADLLQPDERRWKGLAVGVAAGIKLTPLIYIPYLLVTGRRRQVIVAVAGFAGTIGLGYAVLPRESASYWTGGLFLRASRIVFLGTRGNQSLRGLMTRLIGSVAAAYGPWLAAAVAVAVLGLLVAAVLHRAGHPVSGMLACALTGLLVSPLSWDHHWVWAAFGVALLAHLAVRTRGAARAIWWAAAGALTGVFGAWPQLWSPTAGLTPAGLIWYGPSTYFAHGDEPWYKEYHWHGLQLLAGNAYVFTGILALAAFTVAAIRVHLAQRRPCVPPG